MNRHHHFSQHLRHAAAGLLLAVSGWAQAGWIAFDAAVDGVSQIVEVLDPAAPLVRAQTLAFGSGSPGLLRYESTDVLNLANGQGSGSNRFTTASGDQLFGSFTVQLVPGRDASLFDLIGEIVFSGGTGQFLGASGAASFLARGQFVSAVEAVTHFDFRGRVSTVPEPGTAGLGLLALGIAMALRQATWRKR